MTSSSSNYCFVTRRERFSASHILYKKEWSAEKNFSVFGKCSNPYGHGHNYEIFITLKGKIDPITGMVVNLKVVKDIIIEKIIEPLDHRNMNEEVVFMKNIVPTTENLAKKIWDILYLPIQDLSAQLYKIKIKETENNYVTYKG